MSKMPLRTAIIGLGGFASEHHRVFAELEAAGECRVIAGCDPHPENFVAERAALNFAERGIDLYTDYLEMLDVHKNDLDIVVVPTPIPLHAPMHKSCVDRGFACYLEKPPTLFWREMDEMLTVEEGAGTATNVGFVHIAEPPRQQLKRRIVAGEFGSVRRSTFLGHWPRDTAYFGRAPWAGRLMLDDRLVLDSCVGNAMSHFVHDLLFWSAGNQLFEWASVSDVECELYRAHAIQGFDSCFARGHCDTGVEFRIAASHAASGQAYHRETIECDLATITYITGADIVTRVEWHDGRIDEEKHGQPDLLKANVQAYLRFVRGETDRPLSRLIDTKPFVLLNDLLYVAAGRIGTVPQSSITRGAPTVNGGVTVAIGDIEQALEALVTQGTLPSESGLPWANPGGRAVAGDQSRLETTITAMIADNAPS